MQTDAARAASAAAVPAEFAGVAPCVYGVDLGTTHTVVARVDDDGGVRCVPLGAADGGADSVDGGAACMPSVVAVTPGDHVLVGAAALRAVRDADVVAAVETKRILGRAADDPYLARETQRWTVSTQGDGLDGVAVHVPSHAKGRRERGLTAMGAAVCILSHAARCTRFARPDAPLRHAVIAAPVHFTDEQRGALLTAYACVGINVRAVLHEPQAAAWAAVDDARVKPQPGDTDLIVDLGGGTFDVGVVQWEAQQGGAEPHCRPVLLSSDGDAALGGMNVDAALLDAASAEQRDGARHAVLHNKHALECALLLCRAAKEALSHRDAVTLRVPTWEPVTLTAAHLTAAHDEVLRMVQRATQRALQRADVPPSSICRVIHVGGASRAAPVRQCLLRTVPGAEHVHVRAAATAVARGAARYARVLAERDTALTAGAAGARGSDGVPVYAEHGLCVATADGALHPLLPRGATAGVTYCADEFTTDREKDNVRVQVVAVDAAGAAVGTLGTVTLQFPLALNHRLHCVRVDARMDVDGRVTVDVWDQATRASCSSTLQGAVLPTTRGVRPAPSAAAERGSAITALPRDAQRVEDLRGAVFLLENHLARANRFMMHPDFVAACGGSSAVNTVRFTLDAALQSATLFMRQVRAHHASYVADDVADALGGVADYTYKAACALGLRHMVVNVDLLAALDE